MSDRKFAVYRRGEPSLRIGPPATRALVDEAGPSANDRFKNTLLPTFLIGLLPAVAVHFAVFALFPPVKLTVGPDAGRVIAALELPPDVKIPAPPEPVARPATPVLSSPDLSEQLTIAPTTFAAFDAIRVDDAALPPPVVDREDDRPRFIPYDVPPRLINKGEALTLLDLVYPEHLKRAGIGGTVQLWVHVGEEGAVLDCRIAESSGRSALDEAARVVAYAMRFSPALTRDRAAAVWITQPIVFRTT